MALCCLLLVDTAVRLQKEAFVTGLQGTSEAEVVAKALLVPLLFALHAAASRLWGGGGGWLVEAALYSACVLTPLTLALTVAADYTGLVAAAAGAALLVLEGRRRLGGAAAAVPSPDASTAFLSLYRVALLLSTAVAILAVDFPLFPRRLAKTEEFGVSPMDAGVGGFIFSAALTSYQARHGDDSASSSAPPQSSPLWSPLRRCAPLLALGGLRWLSVWASGYQSHVTEYGVHWNFFFTLSAVQLAASLLFLLGLRLRLCGPLALLLLCAHQAALSRLGLTAFILQAERRTWLEMNREGVASVVGYLALHLLGLRIGAAIHSAQRRSKTQAERWRQWLRLMSVVAAFAGLHFCSGRFVQPVSRRLLNASYVCWQVWLNLLVVCALWALQLLSPSTSLAPPSSPPPSALLSSPFTRAVADHSLVFFLASNVGTGAVNLGVDTLHADTATALALLLVYVHLAVALTTAYAAARRPQSSTRSAEKRRD